MFACTPLLLIFADESKCKGSVVGSPSRPSVAVVLGIPWVSGRGGGISGCHEVVKRSFLEELEDVLAIEEAVVAVSGGEERMLRLREGRSRKSDMTEAELVWLSGNRMVGGRVYDENDEKYLLVDELRRAGTRFGKSYLSPPESLRTRVA